MATTNDLLPSKFVQYECPGDTGYDLFTLVKLAKDRAEAQGHTLFSPHFVKMEHRDDRIVATVGIV